MELDFVMEKFGFTVTTEYTKISRGVKLDKQAFSRENSTFWIYTLRNNFAQTVALCYF